MPSGPMLATDHRTGTVYLTYATKDTHSRETIVLARSTNQGRDWTHLIAVNGASLPHGATSFQPEVAVDGNGAVGVFYLVLLNPNRAEPQLVISRNGGTTFAQPIRVGTVSFDPTQSLAGGKEGQWWIGDYQALTAGPTTFYPCWGDNRTGTMQIYTATITATP